MEMAPCPDLAARPSVRLSVPIKPIYVTKMSIGKKNLFLLSLGLGRRFTIKHLYLLSLGLGLRYTIPGLGLGHV